MATDPGEPSYLLRVREIVEETADARSIVFDVPPEHAASFAFSPGQFLTLGIPSDQTGLAARCYSVCVPPGEQLAVTVKRTADGFASNWLHDHLAVGDEVRVLAPSGIFTPKTWDVDLLLWAGGSGITPVMSILRTALRDGTGRVVLFYANRDERSVIFADALRELAAAHPERLQVVHWLESVQGLPSEAQIHAFAASYATWTSFCCGPAPFMKAVSTALRALDFPRERRHQEKFVSLGGNPFGDVEEVLAVKAALAQLDDPPDADADTDAGPAGPIAVEVELDGQQYAFDDWTGREPLLNFLEHKGVRAPFSCREGQCSACAFVLLEGEVRLERNEVLDDDDLAEGIRLGCQCFPVSEKIRLTYNG